MEEGPWDGPDPLQRVPRDPLFRQILSEDARRILSTVEYDDVIGARAALHRGEHGSDPYELMLDYTARMCERYGTDGIRLTDDLRLVPDYHPMPAPYCRMHSGGLYLYAGGTCLGMIDSISADADGIRISSGPMTISVSRDIPSISRLYLLRDISDTVCTDTPSAVDTYRNKELSEWCIEMQRTLSRDFGTPPARIPDPESGEPVSIAEMAARYRVPQPVMEKRAEEVTRAIDRLTLPMQDQEKERMQKEYRIKWKRQTEPGRQQRMKVGEDDRGSQNIRA